MAQRLPIPGSDDNTWGDILNGFLEVSHAADGTLNAAVGGDLAGNLPNPTVVKINGVALPGSAPSAGQVLTAASSNATTWSASGSAPVSSVFGRTGAVVAANGDYTAAEVGAEPVFNVKTYGAVGNGSTDDTSAIQSAITAAGTGSTVYFPQATYVISSALAPLSGQTWTGAGTLLLKANIAANIGLISATSVSNVTIGPGLTFDGNSSNQTNSNNSALIYLVSPSNCVLSGITVQNVQTGGVSASTCAITLRMPQNCRIENSYIYNVGYGIILGSLSGDSTPMYGNVIDSVIINTTGWDAIFMTENFGSNATTVHGYLHDTVVTGCIVYNVGNFACEVGSGSVGTTVHGLSVDTTAGGGSSEGPGAVLIRDSVDISISNVTYKTGSGQASNSIGISLDNLNGTNSNISITNCSIDTAWDGLFDGSGATGLTVNGLFVNNAGAGAGTGGIRLNGTSQSSFSNCVVLNTQSSSSSQAFYLGPNTGCHDITITGCVIANSASGDGMVLNNTSHDIVITGNRIGPSNVRGFRIFDTASHDVTFTNNDVSGNTTNVINNSTGANVVLLNNNGSTVSLGEVKASDFATVGLTGATAASRYVGATASGAPSSGTFAIGDFSIDQTGHLWVCTAAGTPGTWANAGTSAGVSSFNSRSGAVTPGNADYLAVSTGGLTGAVAATRYVGGTTSGSPTSGTFAVGDYIIDQTGLIWTCTSAGTPGTWVSVSGQTLREAYSKPSVALAESFPRTSNTGGTINPASGTLYLQSIVLTVGLSIGHIAFGSSSPGQTTPTNWWFALFDNNRNMLANTADQGATVWASATLKSLAITTVNTNPSNPSSGTGTAGSSITTPYTGLYYIGIMQAAATPASLTGTNSTNSVVNGLTPVLQAATDTIQTTIPTMPHQTAAFSVTLSQLYYGYVAT